MESTGFAGSIQVSSDTHAAAQAQMETMNRAADLGKSAQGERDQHRSNSSREPLPNPQQWKEGSHCLSGEHETCRGHIGESSLKEFSFEPLGERTIKGKGLLSTYLVKEGDWESALSSYRTIQQQAWSPTPEGLKAHRAGFEEGFRSGVEAAKTSALISRPSPWPTEQKRHHSFEYTTSQSARTSPLGPVPRKAPWHSEPISGRTFAHSTPILPMPNHFQPHQGTAHAHAWGGPALPTSGSLGPSTVDNTQLFHPHMSISASTLQSLPLPMPLSSPGQRPDALWSQPGQQTAKEERQDPVAAARAQAFSGDAGARGVAGEETAVPQALRLEDLVWQRSTAGPAHAGSLSFNNAFQAERPEHPHGQWASVFKMPTASGDAAWRDAPEDADAAANDKSKSSPDIMSGNEVVDLTATALAPSEVSAAPRTPLGVGGKPRAGGPMGVRGLMDSSVDEDDARVPEGSSSSSLTAVAAAAIAGWQQQVQQRQLSQPVSSDSQLLQQHTALQRQQRELEQQTDLRPFGSNPARGQPMHRTPSRSLTAPQIKVVLGSPALGPHVRQSSISTEAEMRDKMGSHPSNSSASAGRESKSGLISRVSGIFKKPSKPSRSVSQPAAPSSREASMVEPTPGSQSTAGPSSRLSLSRQQHLQQQQQQQQPASSPLDKSKPPNVFKWLKKKVDGA
ncbi:hypothetical protein DUNSADRAFT_12007 [Dunaliella salina]|uniref:Uncharacterized protein n=1 Tax=Dunaliella salina TaxID=3046 RepID=A0ABQ7GCA4_DUNSA|nr:hypothetical protein DUNSADRAFT_12007 [Dunaliella salina]|eukprot:KAF5832168.1 hypothetical protein DUNSADRAFT_12007 [Dunaliella salina]